MTAGRSDRLPVRIRRRGRHTSPSQVEKVAQQAGKAAPAVAIAGALVAAPQASHALAASAKPVTVTAHTTAAAKDAATTDAATTGRHTTAATLDSFATRTVTVAAAKQAQHAAAAKSTYYQVRSGDSLSAIADRYYHSAGDWQYLYHENDKTVSDPNLIYPGQRLLLPATVPAHYALTSYVPRHAAPAQPAAQAAPQTAPRAAAPAPSHSSAASHTSAASRGNGGSSSIRGTVADATVVPQSAPEGMYSCSGLEQLWDQAGGNSADAFMAAEIAMAESSGNPNAISPTDDFGLWQINAVNGALATLNPFDNARSAITLSDDGANWGPWTTFTSGAYSGKC
jgi:LysM repeat protein